MTHLDIIAEIHKLNRIRRERVRYAVEAHHEQYKDEYARLQDVCGEIGHVWKFSNFGPVGDPWYCCGSCNLTRIGPVEGL